MLLLWLVPFSGYACSALAAEAVDHFDLSRYLGTWYEVARLDNWYEWGLEKVTATYSMRRDGLLRISSSGYDPAQKRWKTVVGTAKFAGDPAVGVLKGSFWGPFSSTYTIFALDHSRYSWAMVAGNDHSYLWVLSRTPQIDPSLLSKLLIEAKSKGFDTLKVIRTRQESVLER
ncbi:MAG: lipocalin family protein [Chlorobiales bacterium]|nr:lipocalin family protein [Chlorobiales bacterium]